VTDEDILDHEFIHVDDIVDRVAFVAKIRALNDNGVEVPWMWSLTAGSGNLTDPNRFSFGVGVNGAVGALHWASNDGNSLVPTGGTNADSVMYRLAGLHDSYMPPGSEIDIDTVYEALSEFLNTRALPACVNWRPTP
jgi:hypothetical protein